MKRILTIGLVLLLAMGAIYAVYALDNVANTKHNLSSSGTGSYKTSSTTDICVFCHTPHNASTTQKPLWNRSDSPAFTANNYAMYTSATMNMTVQTQPKGVSLACLSCHDGLVAFDSLLNRPGSGTSTTLMNWAGGLGNKILNTSTAYLGSDLTNDHPISITYNVSQDGAFNAIVSGKVGNLPLYDLAVGSKNQVECGSCHNPHDSTYGTFLRASNAGSALCLKCHIK